MSTESEIPFVIFLKSIYEVRPKKNYSAKQTHHWKFRIEGLKSDEDIRRVEFVLHNTFERPVQVIKKPPFEIQEDGFGNFEMLINVKILNRNISIPYLIELFQQKHVSIQYHHFAWMVRPKDLEKVLDIGGIPMESSDNSNDHTKALTKICEYVKKHGDRAIEPSMFHPKVYERVLQKIRKLQHSETVHAPLMNNTDMDMGLSDDSSTNRHSQAIKQHRHNKPPVVADSVMRIKPRPLEFEPKKEMKRKKQVYDTSSDSDGEVFGKTIKKNDNGPNSIKSSEPKPEKLLKRPEIKPEPSMAKLPIKPPMKIENKLQKPPKEPKMKLKLKDSNPDSISKLFDVPDLIVLNKGKANLAKDKNEFGATMSHDNPKRKLGPRDPDHGAEDSRLGKKLMKPDNRQSLGKESKHSSKSGKNSELVSSKPALPETKKHKLPEKTMPPDQKKDKKSEHKTKKPNSSFYSKPLSSLSSSASELGSISSKSSSDNEVDPELFRRKKSPIDQSKVVVKQLFGDDNDGSDDDDQADDIADLFSVLKNSGTKQVSVPPIKRRKEPSVKSDDDISSENEAQHNSQGNVSHSQSPEIKPEDKSSTVKDKLIKASNISASVQKNVQEHSIHTSSTETAVGQTITLKERRKVAKMLLKIKNKKFFTKFQRLLLTSFENGEKSVSFDRVTLRLDFHMGEVSDELVRAIRSMVEEYMREHNRSSANVANGRG